MTLSTYAPVTASGNGSTTDFPFTFPVRKKSDLVVATLSAAGVRTPLTLGADYNVALTSGGAGGGTVRMSLAPAAGTTVQIKRIRPLTQETSIRNQTSFYPVAIEDALDDRVMVDQQQQEDLDRLDQQQQEALDQMVALKADAQAAEDAAGRAGASQAAAAASATAAATSAASAGNAAASAVAQATAALQSAVSAAQSSAESAASSATAAQSSATAAEAQLANWGSDNVLSPVEKSGVIQDYANLMNEQTGLDAQATSYGLTALKAAYDTALSALTTYLGTLTSAAAWNDLSGNTTIVGTTFRANFEAAYTARQNLLNGIYSAAQILANNAQAGVNSVVNGGTPIGGGNLLSNSAFLYSQGGFPNGYSKYDTTGSTSFSCDAGPGVEDPSDFIPYVWKSYMHINLGNNAPSSGRFGLSFLASDHKLVIGKGSTCVLSFYAKSPNLNGQVKLDFDNAPASVVALVQPNLSNTWQRYVFVINMHGTNPVPTTVRIYADYTTLGAGGSGTSDVFFGGMQLEGGQIVTAWKPSVRDQWAISNFLSASANEDYGSYIIDSDLVIDRKGLTQPHKIYLSMDGGDTVGRKVTVVNSDGSCNSTNTIKVYPTNGAGGSINGASFFTLNTAYACATFVHCGNNVWVVK